MIKAVPFTPRGLRQIRKSVGMSQRELAKKVGYQPESVRHWESGKVSPTLFAARACLEVLNNAGKSQFTLDDLFP